MDGVKLGIFLFGNAGFFFRGGTANWLPSSAVMVSSWQMLRAGRTVVVVLISRKRLKYVHLIVQLESPGLKCLLLRSS